MTNAPTVGLRLIVAYKFGKAIVQAAAAVAVWVAVGAGWAVKIAEFALAYGEHAVHPLAIRFAHWLSLNLTPGHLHVLAALLGADAVVSAGEGWVLRKGYGWGRWLVVLATGSLLPFELYEIVRQPRAGRLLIFVINAAIVIYLARTAIARRAQPLRRAA